MKNKIGSYVILAAIMFSAMMILTTAVLWASGEEAVSSTTDSFGRLWGRSVLAEYDRNLKDRYGLFAFCGDKISVEKKIDYYAKYSFKDKKYINTGASECMLDSYKLGEKENFTEQLKEAVLADTKPKSLERAQTTAEPTEAEAVPDGSRYIKNQRITASLPSGGKGGGVGVSALAEKLKNDTSIEAAADSLTENIYMFRFFKDYMNDRDLGSTYFENEIEDILTGKLDDEKARKKVRSNLKVIRNILNLAYLYSSSEKRNAAMLAAQFLMPEAPIIAQALILEGWAYMEAENDIKLLYAGKEVPIIKKDENWAVSLDGLMAAEYGMDASGAAADEDPRPSAASGKENANYLPPKKIEGKNYEGYLRILAAALPQETALLRMMDIIQINMKYLYCEYFLIDDCYVGLKYSITVNGRTHEFEEKY